jgi:flagellar protein FliO/FliZ
LGGEKLKTICGVCSYAIPVIAAVLFAAFALFGGRAAQLYAQSAGEGEVSSAGSVPDDRDAPAETDPSPAAFAERDIFLGEDVPAVVPPGRTASIGLIIRVILVLVVAALAIYGVVYFIKRASRPSAQIDPYLKILSSVHLGANRFVHVVSVGTRAWLVGAGDAGVNLITEIEDKDTINAMIFDHSRKNTGAGTGRFPDFKTLLRRLGVNAETKVPQADNIRKRRERLKGL